MQKEPPKHFIPCDWYPGISSVRVVSFNRRNLTSIRQSNQGKAKFVRKFFEVIISIIIKIPW